MFSFSWCSNVYLRTALHKNPFCAHRNSVFKVFLMKIISTIINSSYTSQIHCRNALCLDPVILLSISITIVQFHLKYFCVMLFAICFNNGIISVLR